MIHIVHVDSGRALEELRGSIYNEIRTSEGAKRQQQRFCGPVVAMTFNFFVSVGIILTNKFVSLFSLSNVFSLLCSWRRTLWYNVFLFFLQVMGRVGFSFPIFLTLIHYTVAWILLAFFKALSLLPVAPPSKTTPFSSIFALGVVMSFATGLANTSLKHNRYETRIRMICNINSLLCWLP